MGLHQSLSAMMFGTYLGLLLHYGAWLSRVFGTPGVAGTYGDADGREADGVADSSVLSRGAAFLKVAQVGGGGAADAGALGRLSPYITKSPGGATENCLDLDNSV